MILHGDAQPCGDNDWTWRGVMAMHNLAVTTAGRDEASWRYTTLWWQRLDVTRRHGDAQPCGDNDWTCPSDFGQLDRRFFFFRTCCTSLHIQSLLTAFVCWCVLFQSYCSNPQVFGRTLVLEFHILHSQTEWNRFSPLCDSTKALWKQSAVKLNTKQTNIALAVTVVSGVVLPWPWSCTIGCHCSERSWPVKALVVYHWLPL